MQGKSIGIWLTALTLSVFILGYARVTHEAEHNCITAIDPDALYVDEEPPVCEADPFLQPQPAPRAEIAFKGKPKDILGLAIMYPDEFVAKYGLKRESMNDADRELLEALIKEEYDFLMQKNSFGSLNALFRLFPRYSEMIISSAEKEGIPYFIAIGIVLYESGLQPNIRNKKSGATGLMQIDDVTARHYNLTVTPERDDRLDPKLNLAIGMKLLRFLYNHYGRWDLSLLAFVKGFGAIDGQLKRNFHLAKIAPETISTANISYARMRREKITEVFYPARIEAWAKVWLWYEQEKLARQAKPELVARRKP
jgi:hypothetical protein